MTEYSYTPHGVCARQIDIALADDNETIESVSFTGGCNGNLKAIGLLVKGANADEIAELLRGNDCAGRGTSCADQLAQALTARHSN